MPEAPAVGGPTSAVPSQMPLPNQVLESLKFSSEAVTAFVNSQVSSLPQDKPLTQEQMISLNEGLRQFPERDIRFTGPDGRGHSIEELRQMSDPQQEAVVIPETSAGTGLEEEASVGAARGLPAAEEAPEVPEAQPVYADERPAEASGQKYPEKAFKKGTPEDIRKKAAEGAISAEEAKMWATTTTKEGRALLGISGRMDAADREILIRRNMARRSEKRAADVTADGNAGPAAEKKGFFHRAANIAAWPFRKAWEGIKSGWNRITGKKDSHRPELKITQPAEPVPQPEAAPDPEITPQPAPKMETKSLPPVEDDKDDPERLLESL